MDQRDLEIVLKLRDEASSELKAFGIGLVDVERKTENLGLRVGDTEVSFKKMAAVGAAAFAAVGYGALNAVRSFESFNSEIERAGAFVGATEEQMDGFRKAAIDAARGTKFTFDETAAALGNFVGGEIDAAEATKELGSVVDLALVAKLTDLQQAVDISSTALTVFKKDGMEMSDVIDIISTVAADVTTRTDSWATALVNSAGAAKSAGFSFKDLNVLFADMVRGGADVNLVWSAFNSAITNIQSPSKQTKEALDQVGITVGDMTDALRDGPTGLIMLLKEGFEEAEKSGQGFAWLTDVLGRQAAPEFALAMGLTNDELNETAGYFEDIEGRGAEMTGRIREAQGATVTLGQSLSELNLTLGQALEPAFQAIADVLQPVIATVTAWIQNNPELARGIILATLAVAGLVAVVGTLGILLPAIIGFFSILAGPVGIIIAIVGVLIFTINNLIGIFDILWNHGDEVWEGLKVIFNDAIQWIIDHTLKPLMEWIDKVKDALSAVASAVSKVVSGAGGVIKSAVSKITGKADGGPVTGGTPYIVGERGPELFVPGANGSIVPNHGLGGGVTVNVYGDVSGEELIEKVRYALGMDIKRAIRI